MGPRALRYGFSKAGDRGLNYLAKRRTLAGLGISFWVSIIKFELFRPGYWGTELKVFANILVVRYPKVPSRAEASGS